MTRFLPTYFTYLVRRTLIGVLGLFAVIWLLVVSIDLIEAMREVGKVQSAGFDEALRMTLFRTPKLVLTLSPFVFLFGTLYAFGQMAKMSEIAVMRSAGLSVWRLLSAPAALAIVLGLFTVLALDPVASTLSARAQAIKNEMRGRDANMLSAFDNGIWLRQAGPEKTAIIHAQAYVPENEVLADVTVWHRENDGAFLDRWDADYAEVTPLAFVLLDTTRTTLNGEQGAVRARHRIPISIDLDALREDVSQPDSLSVWQLPRFTEILRDAGISTLSYELRMHELWSLPLKLAAMGFIACAFALGVHARGGGTAKLMGFGIGAGFALFILAELSTAIGEARIVPIGLAAWAPSILAILGATTLLLYREDG